MNDDLTPDEEQALDALIDEALGGPAPPDLSEPILQRYREAPEIVQTSPPSSGPADSAKSGAARKQMTLLISAIAALAATVMIAIWLRSTPSTNNNAGLAVNEPAPQLPSAPGPAATPDVPQISVPEQVVPDPPSDPKPLRGIPLVIDSTPSSGQGDPSRDNVRAAEPTEPIQAVMLVSKQVESELQGYWDAIGIEPEGEASENEISARLARVLGIELSAEAISNPELLQTELASDDVAHAVAIGWLQQITGRGLSRVDQQSRQTLVDELAACFQSKRNFDETLAGLISGESPSASAFYTALAGGRDDAAMIRRLAALTMNVDLRCTRCHDAYIEGNGRQGDFWAFTAFVRNGVSRDRDGMVTIDMDGKVKSVFYELADGRQRVAQPAVAPQWMNGDADQPITSVAQWSQQLVGSQSLARGVVNSLWQLVHGQPLQGRVVDPISAPHNESLDKLENELVQDLQRSRFNISRTLALIISSPATRRAVPEALLPVNALVASDQEIAKAKNAVDAFAAVPPPRNNMQLKDRIAQIIRSAGSKIDAGDGTSIVAQLRPNGGDKPNRNQRDDQGLASDFPGPTKTLPVQWLARLKDNQSQVQHLGYLAGMTKVPQAVHVTAETLEATTDTPTALTRVWWTIRP